MITYTGPESLRSTVEDVHGKLEIKFYRKNPRLRICMKHVLETPAWYKELGFDSPEAFYAKVDEYVSSLAGIKGSGQKPGPEHSAILDELFRIGSATGARKDKNAIVDFPEKGGYFELGDEMCFTPWDVFYYMIGASRQFEDDMGHELVHFDLGAARYTRQARVLYSEIRNIEQGLTGVPEDGEDAERMRAKAEGLRGRLDEKLAAIYELRIPLVGEGLAHAFGHGPETHEISPNELKEYDGSESEKTKVIEVFAQLGKRGYRGGARNLTLRAINFSFEQNRNAVDMLAGEVAATAR